MPKRSIHLQSSGNHQRRTRRDLEFLCNYWDRLLASNHSYDVRLPDLLRANHLMRHLSSVPANHGLRVNVSFTIFDNRDYLETPDDMCTEMYQLANVLPYCVNLNNNGSYGCNGNATRYNNLVRNYMRQMNENRTAIERDLIRARILASLIECDRTTGCPSVFNNQHASNRNKFPVGNRASSARVPPQERQVNSRENNSCQARASFRHEYRTANVTSKNAKKDCSTNQRLERKEDSSVRFNNSPKTANQHYPQSYPQISSSYAMLKKLQPNNNTVPWRNVEPMETCQVVSKTTNSITKVSHSAKSHIKPDDIAINTDERSINSDGQGNISRSALSFAMDQDRYKEEQGRGIKRKLDDMKDRAAAMNLDPGNQNQGPRATGRIKPHVRNAPTKLSSDESAMKIIRSRIRSGRSIEGRLFSKRRVSSPKYASFLRMFCKEETDERFRGSVSSQKDENEKLQHRRELSAESVASDDGISREDPPIERRTPTPRNTVHTTYNPMMCSSASDPILDSSGLTIQLLRLAVLLYAPALMPALNSLIMQQSHQAVVPSLEGSNDLLTQIFRLHGQQAIPNLPFVSIGSERASSTSAAETNTGSSSISHTEQPKDNSNATENHLISSKQGSISVETNIGKSSNCIAGKDRKWRLTSTLDSDVRLDKNILMPADFWEFEEYLRAKRHPEIVRSLSKRSKNEIVMKEYFHDWLHQLLRQLNVHGAASSDLSATNEEARYLGEPPKTTGESSLEETEQQSSTDRAVMDESLDYAKDDGHTVTEHEEEDSDESFTSASELSTSIRLKQDDAIVTKKEKSRDENSQKSFRR